MEKIKKQRDALTSSVDEKEGEVEEAKKEVQAATKALTSLTRKIATEEATRDQLKRDRKTILQYCKVRFYFFFPTQNVLTVTKWADETDHIVSSSGAGFQLAEPTTCAAWEQSN